MKDAGAASPAQMDMTADAPANGFNTLLAQHAKALWLGGMQACAAEHSKIYTS